MTKHVWKKGDLEKIAKLSDMISMFFRSAIDDMELYEISSLGFEAATIVHRLVGGAEWINRTGLLSLDGAICMELEGDDGSGLRVRPDVDRSPKDTLKKVDEMLFVLSSKPRTGGGKSKLVTDLAAKIERREADRARKNSRRVKRK